MKELKLNIYKDCIVDENNIIVAEKPKYIRDWKKGEEICKVFNKYMNLIKKND